MEQNQVETGLQLIRKETPTLQALLSLNVGDVNDAHTLVLQEIEYLEMHLILKPNLADCLPQSMLQAVKRAIKNNLSLDPAAGLVYLKPRSVNLKKTNERDDKWVKVLECTETANGMISVARQCGRILDVERPKVSRDASGKVNKVVFRYLVPSQPSPRWEETEFDESDFRRWQAASHKENRRMWDNADEKKRHNMVTYQGKKEPDNQTLNWANENYTNFYGGIDPEFARAKAIKHGLKKLGTNANESRMKVIYPDKKEVKIVDSRSDIIATDDELGGNGYSSYEDVTDRDSIKKGEPNDNTGMGATFDSNDL